MSSIDGMADEILGALFDDDSAGDDEAGAVKRRAAKAAARPAVQRAVQAAAKGGGMPRRFKILPTAPSAALGVMAAGATVTYTGRPQKTCRIVQMFVAATPTAATQAAEPNDPIDAIQVNSIVVGTDNMMIGAGVAPGSMFAATVQNPVAFDASPLSQDIVVSLTNRSAAKAFTATAVGFLVETVD